jgi:catechol 2,3-dioxygenase-like lactoylglutathione lyase family enzyme
VFRIAVRGSPYVLRIMTTMDVSMDPERIFRSEKSSQLAVSDDTSVRFSGMLLPDGFLFESRHLDFESQCWRVFFEIGEASNAMVATSEKRTAVRGLGEVALRVNNLDAMQKFYEEAIGLPLMVRFPDCAFFKIANGYDGHTQVLALFDRSQSPDYRGPNATTSTIDHFAFEISPADFAGEKQRLEALGFRIQTAVHAWVHWRSIYITDPEGNEVELVCYDSNV